MNLKEQNYLTKLLEKYSQKRLSKKMRYPLSPDSLSNKDIIEGKKLQWERSLKDLKQNLPSLLVLNMH
jgi:hypothetical protein